MNETFQGNSTIPTSYLQKLQKRMNAPALIRFSIQYTLLMLSGAGIIFFTENSLLLGIISSLFFALFTATLFAPLHECCHYTAFHSRRMNTIVTWLSGFWLLLTPTSYREFHYEHHRHTHNPERDPELMIGKEKLAFWPTLLHEYLILISGIAMILAKIAMLLALAIGLPEKYWARYFAFVKEKFRKTIVWEARIYVLIYGLMIAFLWKMPFILLSFALAIALAHAILAVYLAAEHTGLPTEGGILNKGRSIQTNGIVRFFMWNMPYHVEHHAYPSVPFHAIPQLHQALQPQLLHQQKGYLSLHWSIIKRLRIF